jgi:hypothetical protein
VPSATHIARYDTSVASASALHRSRPTSSFLTAAPPGDRYALCDLPDFHLERPGLAVGPEAIM